MYATLRNNQLITKGHDGAQFVTDIDGPGVYEVKTCRERGDVVEFGTGLVEVTAATLFQEHHDGIELYLFITDHKVEILAPAQFDDYAQKKR